MNVYESRWVRVKADHDSPQVMPRGWRAVPGSTLHDMVLLERLVEGSS